VREVDDVEQAEDHGQPEREQRVERAVDQADQQLARTEAWVGMPKISVMVRGSVRARPAESP
jgi:hypothetical protein